MLIDHYILVKWNDRVVDKGRYFNRAVESFAGVTALPGVKNYKVLRSCSLRENRYDLAIRITLTEEGLSAYDASELHENWKENFTAYMEKKAIFDTESEEMEE